MITDVTWFIACDCAVDGVPLPGGLVTRRHLGRLDHIGIGRPHAGTRVLLLVQDLHIRVINADTGELIRELTLNPDKSYQTTGKPSGWPKKRIPEPDAPAPAQR